MERKETLLLSDTLTSLLVLALFGSLALWPWVSCSLASGSLVTDPLDLLLTGSIALWRSIYRALWLSDTITPWFFGCLAFWYVTFWFSGFLALCSSGFLVLWLSGSRALLLSSPGSRVLAPSDSRPRIMNLQSIINLVITEQMVLSTGLICVSGKQNDTMWCYEALDVIPTFP